VILVSFVKTFMVIGFGFNNIIASILGYGIDAIITIQE
jgi:hypothetical protein